MFERKGICWFVDCCVDGRTSLKGVIEVVLSEVEGLESECIARSPNRECRGAELYRERRIF